MQPDTSAAHALMETFRQLYEIIKTSKFKQWVKFLCVKKVPFLQIWSQIIDFRNKEVYMVPAIKLVKQEIS